MLHWRSLSWWGNEDNLHCFDYNGSQYIVYARHCHSDNLRCIAKYHWRSVDAHFQKWAATVPHTCLPITAAIMPLITVCNNSQLRLQMMQNHKSLRSCHTHFQKGTLTVPHTFLPIKAANMAFITLCNNLQLRLPMMYNQKSLTLHWRSFAWWGRKLVVICSV
jgi:hypothetical protein